MSEQYEGGGYEQGGQDWLAPIEARMDELAEAQQALAEQYQTGQDYASVWEDDDADYLPEDEWADGWEADEEDYEDDDVPDILDVVGEAVDRRIEAQDAEHEIEIRDELFEDLRNHFEILQDPEMASYVVERAMAIAEAIDPDLIDRQEFTSLVEHVARTTLFEDRPAFVPARQRQPANGGPEPYRGVELEGAGGSTGSRGSDPSLDIQAGVVAAAEQLRPNL